MEPKKKRKGKKAKRKSKEATLVVSPEKVRWEYYQKEQLIKREASNTWEFGESLGLKGNDNEPIIQEKLMEMERKRQKKGCERAVGRYGDKPR